jgi:hypothetical protein
LRSLGVFPALRRAIAESHKAQFRVIHFSVQADHVHLIVEADAQAALVRGVQGLAVRCAKRINRVTRRSGAVWASRYHSHGLRTPREVRRGIAYVLLNFRKHLRAAPGIDPRSSGAWFAGWRHPVAVPITWSPVAQPLTWLASLGWTRGRTAGARRGACRAAQ